MSLVHHRVFAAYLDSLRANGKRSTATTYDSYLARCEGWMIAEHVDPGAVTADDLRRYQRWLGEQCRRRDGQPLAASTIVTCLIVVKSAYAWLRATGRLLVDPSASLVLPKTPQRLTVAKEHLTQQEACALIDTAAMMVAEATPSTTGAALAARNLALIAVALATGRRCHGLVSLRVDDLDLERAELRVSIEKSRTGRVLPIATWALEAVRRYLDGPRNRLLNDSAASPWLFVSQRVGQLCPRGVAFVLDGLVAETVQRHPYLTDLPAKRISTHSLRVTFAKLMHDHGCSIRSLNELMLHSSLDTTAAYTPVSVDDLRRALLPCHPRA